MTNQNSSLDGLFFEIEVFFAEFFVSLTNDIWVFLYSLTSGFIWKGILGIFFVVTSLEILVGALLFVTSWDNSGGKRRLVKASIIFTFSAIVFSYPKPEHWIVLATKTGGLETSLANLFLLCSFLVQLLLFLLGALSSISLLGSLGLVLISYVDRDLRKKSPISAVSKAAITLVLVTLPLGMTFPEFPRWVEWFQR